MFFYVPNRYCALTVNMC